MTRSKTGSMPSSKDQRQYVVKSRPTSGTVITARQQKISARTPQSLVQRLHSYLLTQWPIIVSLGILFGTSLFWSILGAHIQLGNADQLVNTMLLESPTTFQGAIFPQSHSFLIKLPLFFLVQLLGAHQFAYIVVTILVTLLTVGALAYILYRIERRPARLSVLYLALAACLLLIPAQPYAGSLLPTNFAMITTRNIEYIVFITGLGLITRIRVIRSRNFIAACLVFGLLFASDHLFFFLSLGGSVVALACYLLFRRREHIGFLLRWALVSVIGYGLAFSILAILNIGHLFHTLTSAGPSPYGSIYSIKDFIIGSIYTVLGIATNFGANEIIDVRIVKDIPAQLLARALSIKTISFLLTSTVMVVSVYAMGSIVKTSLRRPPKKRGRPKKIMTSNTVELSLSLIWSSLAAIGLFIFSQHYYPVDARYLTVILFAGFISLATYTRTRTFKKGLLNRSAVALIIGVAISIPFVFHEYQNTLVATDNITRRNVTAEQILARRSISTLVGDYWRVLPIKLARPNLVVTPLANCLTGRDLLTSTAWKPNLYDHSFAYLLTLDATSQSFPHCSLNEVIAAYGKPNSSSVISGTLSNPKELLLFYDAGIRPPSKNVSDINKKDTVLPLAINDIPGRICSTTTVMNFLAHEDDDILFMNPDLQHDIEQGHCVRSVYFTAGDAGSDAAYWLGRQKGTESAYDVMLGKPNEIWTERVITLPQGQFLTIANPKGNRDISLIFLHLPDGNLQGQGFRSTNNESLRKLYNGQLASLKTVDRSSSYSARQLVEALTDILKAYKPTQVRSQSSYTGKNYIDHSDHTSVARFTTEAYYEYIATIASELVPPITYYLGYPVHSLPANVTGDDLDKKVQVFEEFGKHDGAVCHTLDECDTQAVYGIYLRRQYTHPN